MKFKINNLFYLKNERLCVLTGKGPEREKFDVEMICILDAVRFLYMCLSL
jgi:hypothetical protein